MGSKNKFIALGDIHFPFHSPSVLDETLDFIVSYKPKYIILLGDIVDCYSLSRFDKDPRRILSLQKEFDLANEFLTKLRNLLPKSNIIYIEGNHEKRLQKYLDSHPEISSLRSLNIPLLLGLDALDIPYVKNFTLGDMYFYHGEIVRKYAGQSARGEMDKNDISGCSGHTHRLSHYFRTTTHRDLQWLEAGCLCILEPVYLDTKPDWQNGFVYGYEENGKVYALPYKV